MTQAQALAILKTGANVFLTGEPGSGKTHTVQAYASYLKSHGIEPAITASTGIAATHLGGITIHSWSGIGIKSALDAYDLDRISSTKYIASRVQKTKVLVIDEVSMLSPQTLDMVDAVCREIKQNTLAFGGMQIVFVGDFFQLPPIVKENAAKPRQTLFGETNGRFAYDAPSWKQAKPIVCYLTEQHRQDDSDFLSILLAIRRNIFAPHHLSLLSARKILERETPKTAPKLFSHNADVDMVNSEILEKLPHEARVFNMNTEGIPALADILKKGCLSPETLCLKIGAEVMFTKNNPKEGFVNGTLGLVEAFHEDSGYPVVKTRNGLRLEVMPAEWAIEEDGKTKARVTQLPLRLAWAITVHKSQGMSMDEAIMDLSRVFEFGQGYVALSRVRRLSGLFLLGWNTKAFQVHPDILAKDEMFRQSSSEAEAAFANMQTRELETMRANFIRSCGGTNAPAREVKTSGATPKTKKLSTEKETLMLWNQGKTVEEIAAARGIKQKTAFDHIEKLAAKGDIPKTDLARLLNPALSVALAEIHAAFQDLDTTKLSPVYEKLFGEYSYEDLRIARMML
ncbi:MAG: AAA family ATPase [Candidatus Wildermuthbacteria bacterium]|nr:AAA family ATPase [Candidatus Wildermuthbacteria bacterium]